MVEPDEPSGCRWHDLAHLGDHPTAKSAIAEEWIKPGGATKVDYDIATGTGSQAPAIATTPNAADQIVIASVAWEGLLRIESGLTLIPRMGSGDISLLMAPLALPLL